MTEAAPELVERAYSFGDTSLSLLQPADPDGIFLRALETRTSRMTYWTQMWPAALALAASLPDSLEGLRLLEVGCGLGLPSLLAAARGGDVTAIDWAEGATELLQQNAARNRLTVDARTASWSEFAGCFALVLAAEVLYEATDIDSLLGALPRLGRQVLLADSAPAGVVGDFAAALLHRGASIWEIEQLPDRVWRLTLK